MLRHEQRIDLRPAASLAGRDGYGVRNAAGSFPLRPSLESSHFLIPACQPIQGLLNTLRQRFYDTVQLSGWLDAWDNIET